MLIGSGHSVEHGSGTVIPRASLVLGPGLDAVVMSSRSESGIHFSPQAEAWRAQAHEICPVGNSCIHERGASAECVRSYQHSWTAARVSVTNELHRDRHGCRDDYAVTCTVWR